MIRSRGAPQPQARRIADTMLGRGRSWHLAILLFLIAFGTRLVAVMFAPYREGGGELQSVARSLAETGQFAAAYGASGPTAHVTPVYPALLAVLYRLFGTWSQLP